MYFIIHSNLNVIFRQYQLNLLSMKMILSSGGVFSWFDLNHSTIENTKFQFLFLLLIYRNQTDCQASGGIKTQHAKSVSAIGFKNINNKKRHMIIIKINMCVASLFLLSYIGPILHESGTVNNFSALYLYFFNHIGNPFIYYWLNENFRRKVNELLRGLFRVT